jgi:hypothetical protein
MLNRRVFLFSFPGMMVPLAIQHQTTPIPRPGNTTSTIQAFFRLIEFVRENDDWINTREQEGYELAGDAELQVKALSVFVTRFNQVVVVLDRTVTVGRVTTDQGFIEKEYNDTDAALAIYGIL